MTTSQQVPDPETIAMKIAGQNALAISGQRALERAQGAIEATGMEMASGNRAEFERQLRNQLDPATQLAFRLSGDWNTAEDLVQETILKAVRNWQSFQGHSQFRTWLFRIMINAFRDRQKQPRRTREQNTSDIEKTTEPVTRESESAEATMEVSELGEVVTRLISQLPGRQRETLVLSSYQGMSNAEIAETLGISVANVHSTLNQARKKLKQQLAPYLEK